VQQVNLGVVLGKLMQCLDYLCVKWIMDIVVTRPVLEQVTQDIKRIGLRRDIGDEMPKCRHTARPIGIKMKVGDEQGVGHKKRRSKRRCLDYFTTSALVMITSSSGTS
jgi:hypothetical protein